VIYLGTSQRHQSGLTDAFVVADGLVQVGGLVASIIGLSKLMGNVEPEGGPSSAVKVAWHLIPSALGAIAGGSLRLDLP
jgi:hypothetical protein